MVTRGSETQGLTVNHTRKNECCSSSRSAELADNSHGNNDNMGGGGSSGSSSSSIALRQADARTRGQGSGGGGRRGCRGQAAAPLPRMTQRSLLLQMTLMLLMVMQERLVVLVEGILADLATEAGMLLRADRRPAAATQAARQAAIVYSHLTPRPQSHCGRLLLLMLLLMQ